MPQVTGSKKRMKVSVNGQLVNGEEFFPLTKLAFGIAICQKRNCSLKPFPKNVEDLIILQSGLTAMGQSLGQSYRMAGVQIRRRCFPVKPKSDWKRQFAKSIKKLSRVDDVVSSNNPTYREY